MSVGGGVGDWSRMNLEFDLGCMMLDIKRMVKWYMDVRCLCFGPCSNNQLFLVFCFFFLPSLLNCNHPTYMY